MKYALAGLLFLLASCGGGGGSSAVPVSSSAQGLWTGTTNTNRTVTGLVLNDGTYYVFYSPIGIPGGMGGFMQGNGSTTSTTFTSSNGKDFNYEGQGINAASVTASYVAKQSLNGTVSYPGGTQTTFTSTYDANYEVTPSLATLAGTFTGTSLSQNTTIIISSTGAVTGSVSNCVVAAPLSGTVSARADGNAYNFSITVGATPCLSAPQTYTGLGYFNSSTKTLYAGGTNAARTDEIIFVGTKP